MEILKDLIFFLWFTELIKFSSVFSFLFQNNIYLCKTKQLNK